MAETFVQVNIPTTAGKKMKTFETVDGGGDTVQSEAIVAVDAVTGLPLFPAATGTITSVASAIASVTLLAANINRRAASIYNDSNSRLYVKLGAVASITSFTVRLESQQFYEVPEKYSGIIDGIWSPIASRFARVTELTP